MTESPYNSDSDKRYQMLIRWLKESNIDYQSVRVASADASFRRYFRVSGTQQSLIAVDSPAHQNDNQQFIEMAARLRNSGVHTPALICYSLEKGFMLMEDFGTEVLQQALVNADAASTANFYTEAFNTIATMQSATPTDGLPNYDEILLQTEMQLFTDWYLGTHHGYQPSDADLKTIDLVFKLCIDTAMQQPQAFVHRDYHCRNLMPLNDDSHEHTLGVIDFQDAVKGPVTYDPVSLLKDAYIDWPEEFIQQFCSQHRLSLNPIPSPEQYNRWFDLMGLQRHIKILGIFCRLHHRDNKPQYLNDIPLVLQHIMRTADKYVELHDFKQLLNKLPTH